MVGLTLTVDRLIRAREIGREMGIEHLYLGNVYDTPYTNTYCNTCNATLVTRYGLNAISVGLNDQGRCAACGRDAHVKLLPKRDTSVRRTTMLPAECHDVRSFDWHGDIRSVHVQVRNESPRSAPLCHRRRGPSGATPWTMVRLDPGESFRFILAKANPDETGPDIAMPSCVATNLHEVFDRAHFPTVSVEEAVCSDDVSPLPVFPGQQLVRLQAGGAGVAAAGAD